MISLKVFLEDLIDALLPIRLRSISSQQNWMEIDGYYEACHTVLQHGEAPRRREDAAKLCCRLLLTEAGTRTALEHSAALHPQCRVDAVGTNIFRSSFVRASFYGESPELNSGRNHCYRTAQMKLNCRCSHK